MNEEFRHLKERVLYANLELSRNGLVVLTWGNVSEIDRKAGVVAIKPSGVSYQGMSVEDIVIVDMDGNNVDGRLKPSSDLATHLELYKAFPEIGGVVHTHSTYATAFAQAGKPLPCLGTTHADYFYGEVPCTKELSAEQIAEEYERNTGLVIAEHFKTNNIDPNAMPAVLVKSHAPFAWGTSATKAVENAFVLEKVAEMAILTEQISGGEARPASQYIVDKHYFRKHGKNKYYGQ